jgi:hypothetical protein
MSLQTPALQRKAMEVSAWLGRFAWARRFCVTKRGYLAIVPPRSEPGDLIYILHGTQTPFALRRCTEGSPDIYDLVGECYVHGVMDGESILGGFSECSLIIK